MATTESDYKTTPEGTEFTTTGGRVVFPANESDFGGGVALTEGAISAILHNADDGRRETGQLEWTWTGETEPTRAGDSKVIKLRQRQFGRTRTATVTLVDIADADFEVNC